MEIKICGPGCANCEKAARTVAEAVAEVGIEATVVKVTDFAEMAGMGVLSTPAVVVDGRVQCVGRVPSKKEVLEWLR
jgi:small redox-active disulfide protein 2